MTAKYATSLPATLTATITVAALVCILAAGCSRDAKPANPAGPIEQTTRKGPVSVTLRADRDTARIAEPIRLTVDALANEGVKVTLPPKAKTLGPFRVINIKDIADVPTGSKRLWRRVYELENYSSGKCELPAMTIEFLDRRDPKHATRGKVETKPIPLEITSVLEGRADPRKFRDIKGAVELPAEPTYTWVWITAGGASAAALAGMGAFVFLRLRRNRSLKAHLWAIRQLDKLKRDRLIEAGLVQRYYYRLSDILRQYILRRFALAAPKLTTAEFLAELRETAGFDDEQNELLRQFLTAADMVKFARVTPSVPEIRQSMQVAREFVTSTAAEQKSQKSSRQEVAA
ncbi:MAG: hypothetical protein K8S55_05405 [Phycisphaerae bacterium]|nr:hypothetical protein [Phycisphaerae bacterium]